MFLLSPQSSSGHSLLGLRQYCSTTLDWVLMSLGQEHPANHGTCLYGSSDMCQGLSALVCHKNRPRAENNLPYSQAAGRTVGLGSHTEKLLCTSSLGWNQGVRYVPSNNFLAFEEHQFLTYVAVSHSSVQTLAFLPLR